MTREVIVKHKSTAGFVAFLLLCWSVASAQGADRVVIGNVSRTVEQLPNYAATDKGFFAQEGIQGDVVLIGSTDTLIQALIAGQVNVAIVDPSAAINAVERGRSPPRIIVADVLQFLRLASRCPVGPF